MKKLLTLFAACLAMPAMAQLDTTTIAITAPQEQMLVYDNPSLPVYLGEVTYEPLSKAEKTTTVLTGLLNDEATFEDESMIKGAKQALTDVLYDVPRLEMKTGKISDEDWGHCLVYSAKIVFCNFSEKLNSMNAFDKQGRIVAFVTLTNPATKQVVLNRQIVGESWLSAFESITRCREYTMHNLRVAAGRFLRDSYPLRGHLLDRGFQKGKQKLKQFYIDLGVEQKTLSGMLVDVYIIRRVAGRVARQYLGSGKIIEVEGANLSLCEVTKNGDKIHDAWERGAEIAVKAY